MRPHRLSSAGMWLGDGPECRKPQCQICTHAGTHRDIEHTHTHTHTFTHTANTHAHILHTYIPAPTLVCPLYNIQPRRYVNPLESASRTHASHPGGQGCVFLATLSYSWGLLTFLPTFSIRACAAHSALEPGGPKV